ncbi:hypothetical protein [Acidovorax sp. 99]|uniref:hypothetical protein n=1 Tax=Acidovorax sp. 99 TaxID=2135634 RepID=UPI0010581F8E|nr:hypothetical protein [Acidovorax sp. 99]
MKSLNPDIQLPKPRRLFSLGKRLFSPSSVTSRELNAHGKLHAVGKPALRFDDGAEEHWVHGRLQSTEDSPALYVAESNSCKVKVASWNGCSFHEILDLRPNTHVWCEDGFIHREGAAAVINYGEGDQACDEWWQHGLRHRDGGPAVMSFDVNMWFQRGLMHREDGPALDVVDIPYRMPSPYWNSGWFWQGRQMFRWGRFSPLFDYDTVPADFILRVLSYAYLHSGHAEITEEALEKASTLFPGLAFLLENADSLGTSGEDISKHIGNVLSGVQTSEAFALDGLLDLD